MISEDIGHYSVLLTPDSSEQVSWQKSSGNGSPYTIATLFLAPADSVALAKRPTTAEHPQKTWNARERREEGQADLKNSYTSNNAGQTNSDSVYRTAQIVYCNDEEHAATDELDSNTANHNQSGTSAAHLSGVSENIRSTSLSSAHPEVELPPQVSTMMVLLQDKTREIFCKAELKNVFSENFSCSCNDHKQKSTTSQHDDNSNLNDNNLKHSIERDCSNVNNQQICSGNNSNSIKRSIDSSIAPAECLDYNKCTESSSSSISSSSGRRSCSPSFLNYSICVISSSQPHQVIDEEKKPSCYSSSASSARTESSNSGSDNLMTISPQASDVNKVSDALINGNNSSDSGISHDHIVLMHAVPAGAKKAYAASAKHSNDTGKNCSSNVGYTMVSVAFQ